MNKDIYNPRVANLEQEISKLEKDILNGTYKMESTFHLDLLFQKIDSIWKEYESIHNEIENPVSQKLLLENLKKETEFLKLLTSFVNNLEHYKNVVGDFIEPSIFMNAWNDVKLVLECNNKLEHYYKGALSLWTKNMPNTILYNQEFTWLKDEIFTKEKEAIDAMNRIEEIGTATDRIVKPETYQNDNEKVKIASDELHETIKDAIPAITRLYAVADGKMIDYEVDAEDFKEENRNNIEIDEEYLETLSLVERMEYIKLVMQNIMNSKGPKRRVKYNGEVISIPEKYYSKWVKCQSKMKKCMEQYEKEIVNPLLEEQNENKYKEEYASLYSEFQQVNDRLLSLTENAKSYMNTNQVVAVASLNKEPLYVLKTSLNRFNTYFVEYKRLQKELLRFSERNNLKIPAIESIEKVEVAEKEIYNQIYNLKKEVTQKEDLNEDVSNINTQIKQLRAQLYQMNKGKRFSIFANLTVLYKSSKKAEIAEEPEKLLKSKEYTDKEKESILKDILERTNRSLSNAKGQVSKAKSVLVEQINKVKRGINLLPKKPEKAFKIGNIRDAKNTKRFVSTAAVIGICATVGIQGLSLANSNEVVNAKSIEANMDEIAISSETSSMSLDNKYLENIETNNLKELFKEQNEKEDNVITPKKEKTKEAKPVSQPEIITPNEVEDSSYETSIEDEYVDFGDPFTFKDEENAIIYQNHIDAAKGENELKAANPVDNVRVVDGITYEYNGEYIFISVDQEEAEAIKTALEANGAKQVDYRGVNKNGWEGYFADENVTFTMEGRGR